MSVSGTLFFGVVAVIAVLSAVGTVASRTPIRAAMSLLAHIGSLALLYLLLYAPLLATMQLIVYAGAIVVLFVFVIMLIGPTREPRLPGGKGALPRLLAACFVLATVATLAAGVGPHSPELPAIDGCAPGVAECSQFGGVHSIARVLYREWLVPFELISVLLLVAILGAIAVARGKVTRRAAATELSSPASGPG